MNRVFRNLVQSAVIVVLCQIAVYAQSSWQMKPAPISTRWAADVSPANALTEYPRPQMARTQWQNLNGLWDYAITSKDAARPTAFDGRILAPYPLESALSGVKKTLLPEQRLWYQRLFRQPSLKDDQRLLLHFGAVDWQATVYVNGKEVGKHSGGYQGFSFDITGALKTGENELVVAVWDPTDRGPNPHGKQTLRPRGIQYTPSSGIWQTVWLETVHTVYIAGLRLTPDVDHSRLRLQIECAGDADNCAGYSVEAVARSGKTKAGMVKGAPGADLALSLAKPRLWAPNDPFLYDLTVRLIKNGKVVDTVGSYFGMRKIEVKKDAAGVDRIFLNNRYTYNLGVLDQGFWPDGLHTAPTDEALRFDIEAIKAMGFNTIRKHIKVEPERWYWWCDKLGMLVWQDMPQPANATPEARAEFETESAANARQLYNHPSIVTWVLFNEGWGAYDQERLARWMKQLDPSRLLNGHSGGYINQPRPGENVAAKWVASDMTDIHAYPGPDIAPGEAGKARVLGEYGGIGVMVGGHQWDDIAGWGYIKTSPAQMAPKYEAMAAQLKKLEAEGLSGSIYTQPFDVETEQNGLLTYDRKVVKIALSELRRINRTLLPQQGRFAAAAPAVAALPTPQDTYHALLEKYRRDKNEISLLRSVAVMAHSVNDNAAANQAIGDYMSRVTEKGWYTKNDLQFLRNLTQSSMDRGFSLFYRDGQQVDREMEMPGFAEYVVHSIIAKEEIAARLWDGNQPRTPRPEWARIESAIAQKYNRATAERLVRNARLEFYRKIEDWPEYARTRDEDIQKHPPTAKDGLDGDPWLLNGAAWDAFLHCNDKAVLARALAWSELSIRLDSELAASNNRSVNDQLLDTKANLLYKLGKVEEAIALERQVLEQHNAAAQKAGNSKGPLSDTYSMRVEKMKKGEPTWPKK